MKGKIIRIICMQIILAMLVLSIGCGGKSFVGNEVTSESRETISTELKSTNSSAENNTISVGEVKAVRYSGYKDYYYTGVDGKAYLFDMTGKIIKEYAYEELCPTDFFDGIAMKEMVDTAHSKGYYVITDYDGNVITSKYISSSDRFFKIYNINDEPLIAAFVFNDTALTSEGQVVFKTKDGKDKYVFSTEDDNMKSNGIDVSYLKNTDTSLSYVGDGMAYLHNWYKNSYFINLETKEIFKDTFNAHGDYINGYLSFNGNGGCGIVDTHGNELLDTNIVPELQCTFSQGLYYNCYDKKFYNINGECVIDLSQYDVVNPYRYMDTYENKMKTYVFDESGICKITVNNPSGKNYYGLINTKGEWVIELQEQQLSYFGKIGNNLILLQANGGYEVYDINNKKYVGKTMDLTTNNITHDFYKGKLMYAYNGEIYIYDYNTEKNSKVVLYK